MTSATSSTLRPMGPMASRELAYETRPLRDTRPYVGFSPTTPQKCAGCRMLPPVVLCAHGVVVGLGLGVGVGVQVGAGRSPWGLG